jgi:hypothetical protein
MLTESAFFNHSHSLFTEFDQHREKLYPLVVPSKIKRSVSLPQEVIEAARHRGVPLSEYILHLHSNQRSARIAYVTSVFRGFALLEMARVPVDPFYFELVEGCLGKEVGMAFRVRAGSGEDNALPKAAAALLGADTRASAIEAILLASQRAQVLHEGFIEAARLLEATYYR